jgi:Fur family peroxide stress response transcriptional regulator
MKENIIERLQQKGLKPTPQRLLIYEILAGTRSHPSAEEIYVEARKRYPALSLNTVYKTLEALAKAGEVVVVETPDAKARYEARGEPHHHFLCRGCGDIIDIPCTVAEDLVLPRKYRQALDVHGFQINFFGLCQQCKAANQKQDGGG